MFCFVFISWCYPVQRNLIGPQVGLRHTHRWRMDSFSQAKKYMTGISWFTNSSLAQAEALHVLQHSQRHVEHVTLYLVCFSSSLAAGSLSKETSLSEKRLFFVSCISISLFYCLVVVFFFLLRSVSSWHQLCNPEREREKKDRRVKIKVHEPIFVWVWFLNCCFPVSAFVSASFRVWIFKKKHASDVYLRVVFEEELRKRTMTTTTTKEKTRNNQQFRQ